VTCNVGGRDVAEIVARLSAAAKQKSVAAQRKGSCRGDSPSYRSRAAVLPATRALQGDANPSKAHAAAHGAGKRYFLAVAVNRE
jgi:hypothetical protein